MRTLQERFQEELDFDVAAYELGVVLGLFPENDPDFEEFRDRKGVFWSDNPLGNALHYSLQALVGQGFLLKTDETGYRWNPTAPGYQEGTTLCPRSAQLLEGMRKAAASEVQKHLDAGRSVSGYQHGKKVEVTQKTCPVCQAVSRETRETP